MLYAASKSLGGYCIDYISLHCSLYLLMIIPKTTTIVVLLAESTTIVVHLGLSSIKQSV